MIKSNDVNSACESVSSTFSTYLSEINKIDNNIWQGSSSNSLVTKFKSFENQYKETITSQLNNLSSAIDLYNSYLSKKNEYNNACTNYNVAVSNKNQNSINYYSSLKNKYYSELISFKSQIESKLTSISNSKIGGE